jgi:hypothetical protein
LAAPSLTDLQAQKRCTAASDKPNAFDCMMDQPDGSVKKVRFFQPVAAKKAPRPIDQLGTAIGMGDMKKFEIILPLVKDINQDLNAIGETPLTLAAYNDQPEMVDALLQKGADVNHQTKNGYSALIFTAMVMRPPVDNAIQTAKLLLNAGADKTLKNSDGDTAYSVATKKNATALANLMK